MRFRNLSLKWKFLIAFLFLSFVGTTTIVLIAMQSQTKLIDMSERSMLKGHYQHLLQSIEFKENQALSLADAIAKDPSVIEAFERRDRDALYDHLLPVYEKLRNEHGVRQIHFHTPPAKSFLRIHQPTLYGGDMSSYRRTIIEAFSKTEGVGGLEWGDTGYGIRGVVPVISTEGDTERPIGTVEIGFSFGRVFAEEFKERYGCSLTVYVRDRNGNNKGSPLPILATTLDDPKELKLSDFRYFERNNAPVLSMPMPERKDVSSLLGPVMDYSEHVSALVEIRIDRRDILALLSKTRNTMFLLELIGLIVATLTVWILVHRFLLPVREMVRGAAQIASGNRIYMPIRSRDEMGRLAMALNNMVGFLEASRSRMKDYAEDLEEEVQERTRELRKSEEKYRALVENVPLIVYQMTPDREVTFINLYAQDMLGIRPSDIIGVSEGLDAFIHAEDRDYVQSGFRQAVAAGSEWSGEYRLETPKGKTYYVSDYAIPIIEEHERVNRMDGIIVDSTAQKKLQEKTLQTEELRTLGEISARLAHEIRNPLMSIGGLTRRLLKEMPEDHKERAWIKIIITQVQRLESILHTIISYIQPLDVKLKPCDIGEIMEEIIRELLTEFRRKNFDLTWTIAHRLPKVAMNEDMFRKAFTTLCRHTLFFMDEGGRLHITSRVEGDRVLIRWQYPNSTFSRDDLDHYFYPFVSTGPPDPVIHDLPIAKIILHKHGGLIQVSLRKKGEIVLAATLPVFNEEPLRAPDFR